MNAFRAIESVVVPIDRANIDTDALLAKQFMKSISRTGFGDNLFDQWRYLDKGEPGMDHSQRPKNPDFPLNQAVYASAQILLVRDNFGCGSSREHAVWALSDYGIRVILAPSFADIFYGNCFKNGLLPIRLDPTVIDNLFAQAKLEAGLWLKVDLETQVIEGADGGPIKFEIDAERKRRLLLGLDDIGLTLAKGDAIASYEAKRRLLEPWLFRK
ncbi:3-isopropylmalate dehydratase small subunit [Pandoraea cepalis]|uniref:3-isopropylmalate dehydratase small subunit n=1 Tax=Pandoraea cepalis TaxID=2508294 RepID=A0A5E4VM56_9BURK|nr:3-isopropylmalate dehydratase small subunit [Pandoraea cepalis]VVE13418.1 3-isopropylmalate dehydratase small subunit [Pandoraea cepalis]